MSFLLFTVPAGLCYTLQSRKCWFYVISDFRGQCGPVLFYHLPNLHPNYFLQIDTWMMRSILYHTGSRRFVNSQGCVFLGPTPGLYLMMWLPYFTWVYYKILNMYCVLSQRHFTFLVLMNWLLVFTAGKGAFTVKRDSNFRHLMVYLLQNFSWWDKNKCRKQGPKLASVLCSQKQRFIRRSLTCWWISDL